MKLLLKDVVFTFLVPGTTVVLLPEMILSSNHAHAPGSWGAAQAVAVLLLLGGLAVYVRCVWDFALRGRGTPAPIDPPRELVVQGLYRFVRNPMYIGAMMFIAGEVAFYESGPLALYAVAWFVAAHLFTVLYEEPTLGRKFDGSYDDYRHAVRRWIPGRSYQPQA